MRIAYIRMAEPGATNRLLAELAQQLMAQGRQLAGAVQFNADCPEGEKCDMDLQVLPNGPMIRISQSLGPEATGCRLNPDALERAVGLSDQQITQGAELLIVNKFGKHEAEGRGFRSSIALALQADLPVLVGVNDINLAAFEAFTGHQAEALPADLPALLDWITRADPQS